jgi:hypothetical protein
LHDYGDEIAVSKSITEIVLHNYGDCIARFYAVLCNYGEKIALALKYHFVIVECILDFSVKSVYYCGVYIDFLRKRCYTVE